jgi:hypothetical protein
MRFEQRDAERTDRRLTEALRDGLALRTRAFRMRRLRPQTASRHHELEVRRSA